MKCPKCGADNPDSAEYCSLCMEKMAQSGGPSRTRIHSGAPGDVYTAPGEWRGDAEVLRPEVSKVVVGKLHKYRVKLVIYGVVTAVVVVLLVLSFTLWGNPGPGEKAMMLFDAVNARDEDAFLDLFQEQDRETARGIYAKAVSYLGETGRYSDIKLDVSRENDYDAVAYVESGTIQSGGGYDRSLTRSDNLIVVLENHKGVWYVITRGTDILP